MTQTLPLVELSNVTKRFGKVTAVDNANFTLSRGSVLTILGPSGCGKTTLLRMIAGFESPTTGDIRINGQPVQAVPPYKRSKKVKFSQPYMKVGSVMGCGLPGVHARVLK